MEMVGGDKDTDSCHSPGNFACAPDYVLSMIKFGCSGDCPCSRKCSVVKILLICHAQCSVLAIAQVVLEMVRRDHRNGVVSILH